MRSQINILVLASVIIASAAVVSTINAHEGQRSSEPMIDRGMMSRDGMMGMMGPMMQMMDHCSQMMPGMMGGRDAQRPNDLWRKTPMTPEDKH